MARQTAEARQLIISSFPSLVLAPPLARELDLLAILDYMYCVSEETAKFKLKTLAFAQEMALESTMTTTIEEGDITTALLTFMTEVFLSTSQGESEGGGASSCLSPSFRENVADRVVNAIAGCSDQRLPLLLRSLVHLDLLLNLA